MHRFNKTYRVLALTAMVLALTSCGGGGGGGGAGSTAAATGTQISGTAAFGAPFALASITLTDSAGTVRTTTAGADGKFTITTTDLVAPVAIFATGSVGGTELSFVAVGDSLSTAQTLNVTPLTTAVAALLSDTNNPFDMTDPVKLKAKVTSAELARIVRALRSVLSNVVNAAGANAASFDPMASAFNADRTGLDSVLDAVKVTVTSNGVTLTNALAPTQESAGNPTAPSAPSITLTKLTIDTPPAALAAPTVNMTTIVKILDKWRDELDACFARQVADRVTIVSGSVTATKNECAAISGFDASYKSNGYTLLQRFNASLQASDMTGAKFGIPEIMSLVTKESGEELAIFRVPYKRVDGSGDQFLDVAKKVGAATATDSGWRVVGNQRDYDAAIESRIDRGVDLKTGKVLYVTGLRMFFAPFGPNASDVTMVRVTGPGLPAAGVVLSKSVTCGMSNFYAIFNKTGALNAGVTTNTEADLSLDAAYADGSAFTWPAANINYANAPVDTSTLKPFSRYKFEIFRSAVDKKAEFYAPSIAAPLPAKIGNSLKWNELSAASKLYLNPAHAKSAAQTSMALDWTLTAGASPVEAAYVYGYDIMLGKNVLAPTFGIKSNATSTTITPNLYSTGTGVSCATQTVPALVNTGDLRLIALRSRTRDEVRQHSAYYYQK